VTPSDGAVEVCLTWRALERVRTGYSVFVHVLADSGDPLGQADAPPPFPTEFWSAGETVRDCLHVDTPVLPAEGWQVALGMYDRATMQRLPVRAASGAGLPHGAVVVRP
jgi:hypothetical protein